MTKKTGAITAVLAAIALTVLAFPATAEEPESEAPEPLTCVEHDETSMPHDAFGAWPAETDCEMTGVDHRQMHDHMHTMMTMMHGDDCTHEMDETSMPGALSMMNSAQRGVGAMTAGPSAMMCGEN